MADHQALKWDDVKGTNLELFEERLRALSKNRAAYSSLTQKFRQDIRSQVEYLHCASVMRLAVILLRTTRDIRFVLNSEGKGNVNLSVKIKGQRILFAISSSEDFIGLDPSPVVSKLRALAEKTTETGDSVTVVLELQTVGYTLNIMQSTLEERLNDGNMPREVAAAILLYPETIVFASPKGALSRDLGVLLTIASSEYPILARPLEALSRALRTPVAFNGKGVESKKKSETILEAIGAAGYGFISL